MRVVRVRSFPPPFSIRKLLTGSSIVFGFNYSVSECTKYGPFGHRLCSPDHRNRALPSNRDGVRSVVVFVSQNIVAVGLRVGFLFEIMKARRRLQ